jgi:two-component system sensor histidine kinase UhpB
VNTTIKILVVEHDPADLELIHHELKRGGIPYISAVVQNEPGYVLALKNFIPDIILADYTFPSFSGPAAFVIKEKLAPDTPFLFVSGSIGEERSVELIKNGVTDYVLKDKLFTLSSKVIRALKEAKERREQKQTEQELILSEKCLARAQHVAHIGSWELNFLNNTVRLSDEACRIYGLLPDQNIQSAEDWLAFVHPGDVDILLKKIKISSELPLDFSIHYRIVNKSGCVRHIYSEGKSEFDLNQSATGLYGIVHDVTEMVLLENKLVLERLTKQREITAAVLTAQENERAAIGKVLHENLNHILCVSKLHIELAKKDDMHKALHLDKSVAHIVTVIEEIRKISKTLRKPGKHISLYDSITNLLDDLTVMHPIRIHFHKDNMEETRLNEKLQLAIFRIVQEQIDNILKHARATRASITLKKKNDQVILLISDNGKGTDILKEIAGVGIKNIRSRADLYNGIVTIISKPGKGYELKVALPLNDNIKKPELEQVIPAI